MWSTMGPASRRCQVNLIYQGNRSLRWVLSTITKIDAELTVLVAIHQFVFRGLLQCHNTHLMGNIRCYFPICLVEWWSSINGIRLHSSWLRSECSCLFHGRNGLHVGASTLAILPSLTRCRDPTVGAQYRWSANFAPFAPRFWGLVQGTYTWPP